jgi:nitrite reductase (cytochrome c-552)
MQSPLNNVEASCAVCHREKTEQLISDVYSRQDKINESRYQLEKLIVRAHVEAKVAWDNGATEEQMKDILQGIRHAQWRWDYVAASHGGSFHSPVESGRVLSSGIVIAQETRIKLVRLLNELGVTDEIPYPPIDTKADAQIYIGLDVEKLEAEKQEFMKTVVPEWLKKAAEREKTYELTNL